MATQGLISIVNEHGSTLVKIIAGCDGYNAGALAARIVQDSTLSPVELYSMAELEGFGCADDLVVQYGVNDFQTEVLDFGGGDDSLYRDKFHDPKFNPRWDYGIVAHYYEIQHKDGKLEIIDFKPKDEEDEE